MTDKAQELLEWIIRSDGAAPPDLSTDDVELIQNVTISAFTIALEKTFGDEVEQYTVRAFVARATGTWISSERFNPVLAEQIIMSVYLDDHLIDGVPRSVLQRNQNLLTYAMILNANLAGVSLDAFRRDVIELMNEPLEEDL